MGPTRDDLLGYLQKDVKNLNWSVKEWNGLIEAGAIYLILNAFTTYFRISKAIDRLEEEGLDSNTQEFVSECKKVQEEFFNVCDLESLKRIILKLDDTFFAYLDEKISDVIDSFRDSILFEDDDSYPGEFSYDSANDFIELFTGLFHLIKFIDKNYPQLQSSYLKAKFSQLEDRFKKEFYHFTPLEEQLSYQAQRFLPAEEEWWYREKPSEFKYYMEIYFAPLNIRERIGECPSYEDLAGFAFGEVSEEVSQKVEEHIYKCDYCFDEVFQLRNAAYEIPQETDIWIESKLEEIEFPLLLPLPQAADSTQESKLEPIGCCYKVYLKPEDERKLTLNKPDEETGPLAPLAARLQRRRFYYKVYGIHKYDIKEFSWGETIGLPLTIELPQDTNLSMVLIGIDKDKLNENSEKLMEYLIKDEKHTIRDIAWILVKVKNE